MPIRRNLLRAALLLTLGLGVVAWFGRDILLGQLLNKALARQAQNAFAQQVEWQNLTLESDQGHIKISRPSFSHMEDPQQHRHFSARQVELDVSVTGLLSPHVLVHQARIHDAHIVLEYIAPGVSNMGMLEQSYKDLARQRQADGEPRLLEWDVEHIVFQNLRFKLLDYDNRTLADVVIPRLEVDTLSSGNSSEENVALALKQIQRSLLEQTLRGTLEGKYDMPGILHLVSRELPNSRLLSKEKLNRAKETGKTLLNRFLP